MKLAKKPELVDDWKESWRWISTRSFAISTTLPLTWIAIPAEWRAVVPVEWILVLVAITGVFGFIGRITKQVK